MNHITNRDFFENHQPDYKESSVALGNFDGLHRGHMLLVDKLKEAGGETVVFSFEPHPLSVITGSRIPSILSSNEKLFLLERMGIDCFLEYPFDKAFANTSAQEFVEKILSKLNCKNLIIGEDYRFGRNREGNAEFLQEICGRKGIKVFQIDTLYHEGEKISSTRIREAIARQQMEEAEALLGRPFLIMGEVVKGNRIGRSLGFPTANMRICEKKITPKNGVYITKTLINGVLYESITNIGIRPSIESDSLKTRNMETYVFDFSGELYGQRIVVYFYRYVRDETHFESLDQLKGRIQEDLRIARAYFVNEKCKQGNWGNKGLN